MDECNHMKFLNWSLRNFSLSLSYFHFKFNFEDGYSLFHLLLPSIHKSNENRLKTFLFGSQHQTKKRGKGHTSQLFIQPLPFHYKYIYSHIISIILDGFATRINVCVCMCVLEGARWCGGYTRHNALKAMLFQSSSQKNHIASIIWQSYVCRTTTKKTVQMSTFIIWCYGHTKYGWTETESNVYWRAFHCCYSIHSYLDFVLFYVSSNTNWIIAGRCLTCVNKFALSWKSQAKQNGEFCFLNI